MSFFSTLLTRLGLRKAAPTGPRESIEIYVGNLSYDMTDEQLRAAFAKYGEVRRARVIENRHTHKSKGFGFVEMCYRAQAEAAIRALHDKSVMGRRLRVTRDDFARKSAVNGN